MAQNPSLVDFGFLIQSHSVIFSHILSHSVIFSHIQSHLACSGRRSLRSPTKGDFLVPRARTATRQKRAFSIVGPSVWNDLPSELRSLPRDLSSSFYKLLKTLLFGRV